jgi:hypothetical protein
MIDLIVFATGIIIIIIVVIATATASNRYTRKRYIRI